MYKSKTMREIRAEQGITRFGSNKSPAQSKLQDSAPVQGRWRKSQLPKGGAKTKHIIGSMKTGR